MPEIECQACGHTEDWEHGNYFGERENFAHHVCGKPGMYAMCGPDCNHSFPGCALIPEHPSYQPSSDQLSRRLRGSRKGRPPAPLGPETGGSGVMKVLTAARRGMFLGRGSGEGGDVQHVVVGDWGELTVYSWADELPAVLSVRLPQWLERVAQCRPAVLTIMGNGLADPHWTAWPYLAVWPAGTAVPDGLRGGPAWTTADIDGVVLAEFRPDWRCFACGEAVSALNPDAGFPVFAHNIARHKFATHCPRCGAHADAARMHALMLLAD